MHQATGRAGGHWALARACWALQNLSGTVLFCQICSSDQAGVAWWSRESMNPHVPLQQLRAFVFAFISCADRQAGCQSPEDAATHSILPEKATVMQS